MLVIGGGVVGGATARGFRRQGHEVTVVDVSVPVLERLCKDGFTAITPDQIDLCAYEIVFVAVPTPSTNGAFDPTYLDEATQALGDALARRNSADYLVIAYRSTMLPFTTERRLIPHLEHVSGKIAGVDFGVAHVPEFLQMASADRDFDAPHLVCLGCSPKDYRTRQALAHLFHVFGEEGVPIEFVTWHEAELAKELHNVLNAEIISVFNEFRLLAQALGLNEAQIDRVLLKLVVVSAHAKNSPTYGARNQGPYAGPCLPKEVAAILRLAARIDVDMPMLRAAQEINKRMGGK